MGLGHVPPRPLRQAGQGDDFPRREHRGAGAGLQHLTGDRRRLASLGESVAASFLERRGAEVIDRNRRLGRGELDLVVEIDGVLVAVEVKTIGPDAGATHPIDRIGVEKLRTVRRLAGRLASERRRPVRVDFVGVRFDASGVLVNWRTAVA